MINFDDVIKEETKEHNRICSQIPDHPYRIIIGGSASGKTNLLFNLINQQHMLIKFIYMVKILMKQNINF